MPETKRNLRKYMIHNFPFTALVGQERMKQALLLNVINPKIGGVLIRGDKGTAKSTAVRSLAEVVPGGKQVVDLPLGATEDRVVGTLDIQAALKTGEKRFEPGILARAHENILYVDEVNLLEDHLVDLLLDVAAMGVNVVEREGVSYSHPARFILVGTMNPEEGDLRPQLLDRFGLVVNVHGEQDETTRMEIIKRRLWFEKDPLAMCHAYRREQGVLKTRIESAREILDAVTVDDAMLRLSALIGISFDVNGHRADITLIKTASALAALRGDTLIRRKDIQEAAHLVLPHRMKRQPFEEESFDENLLKQLVESVG
jgi:magnesium chelatase subunit I